MIKFLSILLIVCFASHSAQAMQGFADIGAIASNPAANAILVPAVTLSGNQANGSNWSFNVLISATVQTIAILQILNTSSVVTQSIYFIVPANSSFTWSSAPISFKLPNGFSARIINSAAVTGNIQASLFYASDGDY